MERIKMMSLVLAIVLTLSIHGVAFGGGAEGGAGGCPNNPEELPPPTSGPFIYGTFTVARELGA